MCGAPTDAAGDQGDDRRRALTTRPQRPCSSALIALQSGGDAQAPRLLLQRSAPLNLLDRLQLRLLEGDLKGQPILSALSAAAGVRGLMRALMRKLQQIYDEIALRARVELAKRGR